MMPKPIQFLDLQSLHQPIKRDLMRAIESCIDSGIYILGPSVEEFETLWAQYTKSKAAVGVSNGLDAIVIGLKALGIGPGDEVIVPAQTFIATWLAVSLVGAKPIPVDVEKKSANLDPSLLEAARTPKTRAVVVVHLFGQIAKMKEIASWCQKHRLFLIEDAAQAHGAKLDGHYAGYWSELATYSFYPGKNLGALGDAGAITTTKPELVPKLHSFRNYGSHKRYYHEVQGYNARLDPIQASILKEKLPYLDAWNSVRRKQAHFYLENLSPISGLQLPHIDPSSEPSWHLFALRIARRDEMQAYLSQLGIQTLIHYPLVPHKQQAYAEYHHLSFPEAEAWASESLSLPLGPHLQQEDQERVIEAIKGFFKA